MNKMKATLAATVAMVICTGVSADDPNPGDEPIPKAAAAEQTETEGLVQQLIDWLLATDRGG